MEHRARKARFWELVRQDLGRTAACDAVGVDRRQGYRWVKASGGRNPFAHKPRRTSTADATPRSTTTPSSACVS
jgi:transposase-like protein